MTHRVLCVLGTRPEAVKMAPVIQELRRRGVPHCVLSTGQHRDLVTETLAAFDIEVEIDLDVMTPTQTPTMVAAKVLSGLDPLLRELTPSSIIVQGDTTTVVAAAIAGAYAQIPVAHLEAGLRTGNRSHPFPEELNRLITASVADLHLAPTWRARQNLLNQGVTEESIVVTGNTVIDALLWARDLTNVRSRPEVFAQIDPDKTLILMTAHRRESFGERLDQALQAVRELIETRGDIAVLYPVHPNPCVRSPAEHILGPVPDAILCEPLDYLDFVVALEASSLVLTDSGGLQEEAPALGKPVLVMRDTTERPEAVESGVARLVGTDKAAIIGAVSELLDDPLAYRSMARGDSPYGDGFAAQRVINAVLGEPVSAFEPLPVSEMAE